MWCSNEANREFTIPEMNRSRQCILLVVTLLAGCVPIPSTYYLPKVESGTIESQGSCSIKIQKRAHLHLPQDIGVEIFASRENRNSQFEVNVIYLVPPGLSAQLAEPGVRIEVNQSNEPYTYEIKELEKVGWKIRAKQSAMGVMYGEQTGVSNDHKYDVTSYSFTFELPVENPREFLVTLPAVKISNKLVEVPSVKFIRKTSLILAGLCQ